MLHGNKAQGIKSTCLIFKTEMLINQSKANLDAEVLFCKSTHLSNPLIRNKLVWNLYRAESSLFHSGP